MCSNTRTTPPFLQFKIYYLYNTQRTWHQCHDRFLRRLFKAGLLPQHQAPRNPPSSLLLRRRASPNTRPNRDANPQSKRPPRQPCCCQSQLSRSGSFESSNGTKSKIPASKMSQIHCSFYILREVCRQPGCKIVAQQRSERSATPKFLAIGKLYASH